MAGVLALSGCGVNHAEIVVLGDQDKICKIRLHFERDTIIITNPQKTYISALADAAMSKDAPMDILFAKYPDDDPVKFHFRRQSFLSYVRIYEKRGFKTRFGDIPGDDYTPDYIVSVCPLSTPG